MAVIRRNFLTGNTSVLLSAGGTTLTSADLAALPVVAAPDYAWLSLDPQEEHGLPEIVKVTAHSSGAVTATIGRAAQTATGGGSAREHPSGTFWAHPTTALDLADIDTALGVEAAERVTGDTTRPINTQTNDYTLVLADAGKVVEANKATAISVTVPPNASVAFPTGTIIEVNQVGAGLLTVAAGAGVTLNGTLTAPSRHGSLLLRKRATNEWTVTQVAASGPSVLVSSERLSLKDPRVGAVLDGVTDDLAAWDRARVLMPVAGGEIFHPGGLLRTTGPLRFDSGYTIGGAGASSIIKGALAAALVKPTDTAVRTYDVVVRDLVIDNTAAATAGGIGLDWSNVSDGHVENVELNNVETGLLCLVIGAGMGAYYNKFVGVRCPTTVTAFRLARGAGATSGPNGAYLAACRVGSATTGMIVDGANGTVIDAADIENCVTGISLSPTVAADGTTIIGPRFDVYTTGLLIAAADLGATLVGPWFTGAGLQFSDLSGKLTVVSRDFFTAAVKATRVIFGTAGGSTASAQMRDNGSNVLVRNSADSGYYGLDALGLIVRSNGVNIVGGDITLGTGTGSKFGVGPLQKLGFWGATPVVQPAANADTSGATLPDLEIEVNQLKALLRTIGFLAP